MTTNGTHKPKRPVKVASFSGFSMDRFDALRVQAESSGADFLVGDYLAEANVAFNALIMIDKPEEGYEIQFLNQLEDAADAIVKKKLKVITDAGSLNPKGLATKIEAMLKKRNISLKVAYILGDDVTKRVPELQAQGETFRHLESADRPLSSWGLKVLTANAYIGAKGLVAALNDGADIIVAGRVTDASAIQAAAVYWHGWSWTDYDKIAHALLAGHCIECGAYATGGNYSGFKQIKDKAYNFGFPIAEIEDSGHYTVTKNCSPGMNGVVNVDTIRSQLLYEIQGNIYLNPDCQADIKDITVEAVGENRVHVKGVKGYAAPETTKVSITALAGYQAEVTVCAVGLDIEEKFGTLRLQIEKHLGKEGLAKFSVFDFTVYGQAKENPETEGEATSMMRIMAQGPLEAFGPNQNLLYIVLCDGLGHYSGLSWNLDTRLAICRPYVEYWPALLPTKHLTVTAHTMDGRTLEVERDSKFEPVIKSLDEDSEISYDASKWGETTRGPLGWIIHGKSGDKAGNVNVGFFCRQADEYEWLRSFLSKGTLIKLLAKEYTNNRIERVEFPGLMAVHFLLHDYLGTGAVATTRLNNLGKATVEFLRARHVDLPTKFLQRGKI